ncbi:glycosyltransferase family protein [Chryseobacterium potabilaquae]|nr:glycosyltransferase family 4 protein [Chryseobacterium potabilaquae]
MSYQNKKTNKILVISQAINQPRIINRIKSLSKQYENVEVYSFKRNKYDTKNYINLLDDKVRIKIIGEIQDGIYINRIGLYTKLIILLVRKVFSKYDIYSFGLDSGILSLLFIRSYKVYEISDIKWLYSKGILRNIQKRIDYLVCNYSDKINFTSEGFYLKYYSFISEKKISIIENKFKTYNLVNPIGSIYEKNISIAYVGALRYKNILENVLNIISERNYIELNFYGEGSEEVNNLVKDYASRYDNIQFHGKFRNPDDLERIYKGTNINFVCYDNTLENERVALPNKYYESGFFNIPIVCSKNTFLSTLVEKNNMGWSIDIDYDSLKCFFDNLTVTDLKKKHDNIKLLDKKIFIK